MQGAARVAPDVETLASLLDNGLSRARSADLCIRADQIPDPDAYIEERLRRRWVPAPRALLETVRTTAWSAEAASRTLAVSAAETRLSMAHQSPEPTVAVAARAVVPAPDVPDHARQQRPGGRQR